MTIMGYTKQNISHQPVSSCIDGYYVFPNGVNDTNEDGEPRNCSEISKLELTRFTNALFLFRTSDGIPEMFYRDDRTRRRKDEQQIKFERFTNVQ